MRERDIVDAVELVLAGGISSRRVLDGEVGRRPESGGEGESRSVRDAVVGASRPVDHDELVGSRSDGVEAAGSRPVRVGEEVVEISSRLGAVGEAETSSRRVCSSWEVAVMLCAGLYDACLLWRIWCCLRNRSLCPSWNQSPSRRMSRTRTRKTLPAALVVVP